MLARPAQSRPIRRGPGARQRGWTERVGVRRADQGNLRPPTRLRRRANVIGRNLLCRRGTHHRPHPAKDVGRFHIRSRDRARCYGRGRSYKTCRIDTEFVRSIRREVSRNASFLSGNARTTDRARLESESQGSGMNFQRSSESVLWGSDQRLGSPSPILLAYFPLAVRLR